MTPRAPVPPADLAEVRRLFEQLLGPEPVNARAPSPVRTTYTAFVTVRLLVHQRPLGGGPLTQAVAHLLATRATDRTGEGLPSAHTGAHNRARQRLPPGGVERLADRLFEALTVRPLGDRPVLATDGPP